MDMCASQRTVEKGSSGKGGESGGEGAGDTAKLTSCRLQR